MSTLFLPLERTAAYYEGYLKGLRDGIRKQRLVFEANPIWMGDRKVYREGQISALLWVEEQFTAVLEEGDAHDPAE